MSHNATPDLCRALLSLESVDHCQQFLTDLCTPAEIAELAKRRQIVLMLQDKMPYRQVAEQTGVSTTTVSRVARCLNHGSGGYQKTLHNLLGN